MGRVGRSYAFLLFLVSFCCLVASSRSKGKAAVAQETTATSDNGKDIPGFDVRKLMLESADHLIYVFLCMIAFVFAYAYLSARFAHYDLKGKHVFITGGSSGIGIAVAKEYIKRGANITIAARNMEKLAEAVKMLEIYQTSRFLLASQFKH